MSDGGRLEGGTFAVSRRIWTHPEFAAGPFSEREAFLWLVSEAAWKPRRVRVGRVVVDLERGQLCASVRFMATAWQWSKSRVQRFLQRLENRDMIGTDSGTGTLVITLCNYSEYQGERDTGGTHPISKAGQKRDSSGTNEKKGNKGKKEEEKKGDANASSAHGAREADREVISILSAVMPEQSAADFVEHRRSKRAKVTPLAARQIAAKLAGHPDPAAVISESIANGWTGVFPEKHRPRDDALRRRDENDRLMHAAFAKIRAAQ